jgi:hypothetical protein
MDGSLIWVLAVVVVGVLIASFLLPWLQGLFAKKA